jgi:hypothetical protein
MANLNEIPFECTRPITCYYVHPTKGVLSTEFLPNTINRKSAELVGALLAQTDSYGVSPLERYIDAGIVSYLDDGTANGKVEGKIPIIRPPLPAPLQAAAKAYSEAKEKLAPVTKDKGEVEERARQIAIDAGKRVGRAVPQAPRTKPLEHGKAVDVDELASPAVAQVVG